MMRGSGKAHGQFVTPAWRHPVRRTFEVTEPADTTKAVHAVLLLLLTTLFALRVAAQLVQHARPVGFAGNPRPANPAWRETRPEEARRPPQYVAPLDHLLGEAATA
jgi:hypothetical protein